MIKIWKWLHLKAQNFIFNFKHNTKLLEPFFFKPRLHRKNGIVSRCLQLLASPSFHVHLFNSRDIPSICCKNSPPQQQPVTSNSHLLGHFKRSNARGTPEGDVDVFVWSMRYTVGSNLPECWAYVDRRTLKHANQKFQLSCFTHALSLSLFQTAEHFLQQKGFSFKWEPSGALVYWQVLPAFLKHPETGKTVWFNQIQSHHASHLQGMPRLVL